MGSEPEDEADVLAFWRVDGTQAPVVGGVHVAHLKAGPLTGEASGAKSRERAQILKLGEHVLLVHELRELIGSKEFAHRRLERAWIHQRDRKRSLALNRRHAVLDIALHATHPDAHPGLQEFTHKPHPAKAEAVNIVGARLPGRVKP